MLAGQRLLEALIVYSKINVKTNLKELHPKKEAVTEEKVVVPSYTDISALELEKELTQNKKLINMTMGEEGNSSGSDSEPSADNLEEEEMAKLVPQKKKAPPPKIEKKPVLPPKKTIAPIKKPTTSPPAQKRAAPVVKEISRSPTKRPFGYYPFDPQVQPLSRPMSNTGRENDEDSVYYDFIQSMRFCDDTGSNYLKTCECCTDPWKCGAATTALRT